MYVLLCVLACALAAPQPPLNGYLDNMDSYLQDLNKEMAQLGQTMDEVATELRRTTSGFQGNQYNINKTLNGFDEKDITVKAMKGSVQVRAVHKNGNSSNTYSLNDSLPYNVQADGGSWVYEGGVLKIVFPGNNNISETKNAASEGSNAFKNKVEFVSELSGA